MQNVQFSLYLWLNTTGFYMANINKIGQYEKNRNPQQLILAIGSILENAFLYIAMVNSVFDFSQVLGVKKFF